MKVHLKMGLGAGLMQLEAASCHISFVRFHPDVVRVIDPTQSAIIDTALSAHDFPFSCSAKVFSRSAKVFS